MFEALNPLTSTGTDLPLSTYPFRFRKVIPVICLSQDLKIIEWKDLPHQSLRTL